MKKVPDGGERVEFCRDYRRAGVWGGEEGRNYGARCFAQGKGFREIRVNPLFTGKLRYLCNRTCRKRCWISDDFSDISPTFNHLVLKLKILTTHPRLRDHDPIRSFQSECDITSTVELHRIVTNDDDPVKHISNDIVPSKRSIHTYTPTHVRRHNTWSIPLRISKRRVKRERRMVRFFQYLASGRSWAIVDRQPAVTVPRESSPTEAHIVATLPYARHAFLPSAPNIPKSATATWGHLNKNLMWKVTNSPQLRRKSSLTRSLARSCRVLFRSIFSFLSLCSSANCFSNWLHGVPRSFCSIDSLS